MAARQQNLNSVMYGRIQEFLIEHSGSEVININKIKTGNINVTEEIKQDVTELVDGQEIIEQYGKKVIAELTYDEMVQADIESISNGDYFKILTESGGANGTGQYLEISGSDSMTAKVDGIRTTVTVEKSVSTGFPYTISDNA